MEPQPTPHLEIEKKGRKNEQLRPKSCPFYWYTIKWLLITWIGLFLILSFFWLKGREQLSEYQNQLSAIQAQTSQSQRDYKSLQLHVSQLQNFTEQKFSSNNAILLANINQLVQLAQYSLVYFHDTSNALAALTLADKQLSEIISSDIRLENIRQLLTHYLTSLKTLPRIDLMTTLSHLQALKAQITQLPLLFLTAPSPKLTAGISPENKWVHMIQSSLDSFRQLIIIRRLNKPIQPLLPEREQQYLQHNLLLLLQQAQWALIHHETAIYQSSLQEIQENIKDHFVSGSPLAQTVMQSIAELKQIDLQASPPDLRPLLEEISIIEKTIHNGLSTSTTANQKELS